MKKTRGEMAIYYVIFTFVMCCILFPLFQFLVLYEESTAVRNKIQTDMNSFGTAVMIDSRDNLKKGSLKADKIDSTAYESQTCQSLGLVKDGEDWKGHNKDFSISQMTFQVKEQGESVIMFCQYQYVVPVNFVGIHITTLKIPQTSETYLVKKYYSATEYEDKYLTGTYNQDNTKADKQYSIKVSAESGGTVTTSKDMCSARETCTITAKPDPGKTFAGWESETGVIISVKPEYTFSPTMDMTLIGVFI